MQKCECSVESQTDNLEIPRILDSIDNRICRLEEVTNCLLTRLTPVTLKSDEDRVVGNPKDKENQKEHTDLGKKLLSFESNLAIIEFRIRDVFGKLQI
ncbi:MAG: hypothetical protein ACOC22_02725 [bacterium]